MKILIVSLSFYPRISPRSLRATELAKEFSRQGHEVTVYTKKKDIDYTKFSNNYEIEIKDLVKGKWYEIRGKNIISKSFRFLLRYFFLFPDIQVIPLIKKALQSESDYDLLVSIAIPYPVHWGVGLVKKKKKELAEVWVADCGDPFMGNEELKVSHPFYFSFIENWFCKKPDYITIPLSNAIKAYPNSCRDKIKIIPQGFRFDESIKVDSQTANSPMKFAYAGSLSSVRDPRLFLDYLSQKKDKEFKFIIYTRNKPIVQKFKKLLGNKLVIRNYIPRKKLLRELSKMDFLVNIENRNDVQSPSKLIDYSLTGRPILSIKSNSLNKEVIDEFLNHNYSNQFQIENLEHYNIENVVNKFISLAL